MRKRLVLLAATAAIALLSCNKTTICIDEEEINQTGSRVVVFTTEMLESKTSISGNKIDGYKSDWSVGDRIDVFENGKVYTSEPLDESDIDNGVAHFRVNFDEVETANIYRYVAVYPSHYYEEGGNDGPVLSSVNTKATDWISESNFSFSVEEGYYMWSLGIPCEQSPSAYSFDPNVDLLISKEIIVNQPISDVESLQFARIGSMMKITLKGLTDYSGSRVESVMIDWDWETRLFGYADYSSEAGEYVYYGDSQPSYLFPKNTYVRSDGTVDLWIRCFKGQENKSMEIKLELDMDGEQIRMARYVDLESMNKTLEFREGHLAEFSVGEFLRDDINLDRGTIVFRNDPDGNSVVFSWLASNFAKEYECYIDQDNLGLAQINDGIASITVQRSSLPEGEFYFNYYVTAIDGHYSPQYGRYKQMNTSYMNQLDGGIDGNSDGMYADRVMEFLKTNDMSLNTNYYYADDIHNELLGFRNVMMDYSLGFSCLAFDTETSSDGWKIWSVHPHKKMKGVKIAIDNPGQSDIENIRVYGASVPGDMDEDNMLQFSNSKEEYRTYLYYYFDETSDLSYYTITSKSSIAIWSITGLYDF